jgi:Mg2+ and Co2+ transporter CorA
MRILRQVKKRCAERLNESVARLLGDIHDDFREQTQDLRHLEHILERSQDTFVSH